MAVTILEALQNAHFNIVKSKLPFQWNLGKDQLHNAITLLDKGYDVYDEVEPLLEEYGTVEDVPEKGSIVLQEPSDQER